MNLHFTFIVSKIIINLIVSVIIILHKQLINKNRIKY